MRQTGCGGKRPESQSFWMTNSSYPILCQTALEESNHIEDISVYHLPFLASLPRRLETPAHLPGHCINTEHFTALFAVPGVHSDHLYQPKAGLPSIALLKYLPWMSAWNDLSLPGLFSTSCFWEDFVFCITHWSVLWLFGKHDLQH